MSSPGECRSGDGASDKRGGETRDRTRQRADLDTLLPVTPHMRGRDRNRDCMRLAHAASALILCDVADDAWKAGKRIMAVR
jgi:hypothetical protein